MRALCLVVVHGILDLAPGDLAPDRGDLPPERGLLYANINGVLRGTAFSSDDDPVEMADKLHSAMGGNGIEGMGCAAAAADDGGAAWASNRACVTDALATHMRGELAAARARVAAADFARADCATSRVADVVCAAFARPRVAFAFVGAARTLAQPLVHRTARHNFVDAFGGAGEVLAVVKLRDASGFGDCRARGDARGAAARGIGCALVDAERDATLAALAQLGARP